MSWNLDLEAVQGSTFLAGVKHHGAGGLDGEEIVGAVQAQLESQLYR